MAQDKWFIRLRGRTSGPFDLGQLDAMRKRGQFGALHEISADRRTWERATGLLQQIAPSQIPIADVNGDSGRATATAEPEAAAPAAAAAQSHGDHHWYYLQNNQQVGPVGTGVLRQLVSGGTIAGTDMVWREGLPQWRPANSFPELQSGDAGRAKAPLNGLALASFILSLTWLGGVGSLLAVIFGVAARRQLARNARMRGRGLATAGVLLGSTLLVATPLAAYWWFVFLNRLPPGIAHAPVTRDGRKVFIALLGKDASPAEITAAFRRNVVHINVAYGAWKVDVAKVAQPAGGCTGSGVIVASDGARCLIATNRHVVCPDHGRAAGVFKMLDLEKEFFGGQVFKGREITVKEPDWLQARPVRAVAVHKERDMALLMLEVDNGTPNAIPVLRRGSLQQGEGAVAIGNPRGLEFFTTSGVITSTRGEGDRIWTDCSISSGNSGGPLFLKRYGFLAGLNTWASTNKGDNGVIQNLNGAEPVEDLIVSLQNGRDDLWFWESTLKGIALDLAKLVPVVD